ncbi:MAG: hypothetical protein ACREMY_31330, partial [bacterium]
SGGRGQTGADAVAINVAARNAARYRTLGRLGLETSTGGRIRRTSWHGKFMRNLVERSAKLPSMRIPALAVGALAFGALAVGALAIGSLAVGRIIIGKARFREVEIDDLTVRRLRVLDVGSTPRSPNDRS